jgi:hypothetical protein
MFSTDREFEDEVRRIARLLWPAAQFDGASMEDGRERDGIFETLDFVHVLECTTSRAQQKARDDTSKIAKLIRRLTVRHPTKFIKGWFITLDEPTADQRSAVKDAAAREKLQAAQIVTVSFDQFRSQLVDARSYLDHRAAYPFGSVRDPSTGNPQYDPQYVPLELLDEEGASYEVSSLATSLLSGQSFVLLGDYGAGKSATMRELFFDLARRFWQNKTLAFPIFLNLRDHHGQTDPVEALERHARKVGFALPSSLVRAWRGGFAIVLLDGFDEIAAAGWAGKTRTLKELRFRSMELVRSFVRDTPSGSGVILSGRAHFFDSSAEMRTGLATKYGSRSLRLAEFSEHQATQFLARVGWGETIPTWLPSRPLLLAYLASRNFLTPNAATAAADPASGWDDLLGRIANRESEIEAGIDPDTVRRLIERIAMLARNSVDGLGPLSPDVILGAFKQVCGYAPDDRGAVLLQRLPGLGAHHSEDGSRVFIDSDFAEAARGGATFRIIENPFVFEYDSETWQSALLPLGASVATFRTQIAGYGAAKVASALRHVVSENQAFTVAADLCLVLVDLGATTDGEPVYIREVIIPEVRFEDLAADLRKIEFQDSVIGVLGIASDFPADWQLPKFVRCHIGAVDGRTGKRDLPTSRFFDCEFDAFEEAAKTTNAIMSLELPLGTKVMLTVLKKLYAQSGSGRKGQAFYRGLDSRAQSLVGSVLDLLRREQLVARSSRGTEQIWLPTRSKDSRKRAMAMLAAPNASSDPLIRQSKALSAH